MHNSYVMHFAEYHWHLLQTHVHTHPTHVHLHHSHTHVHTRTHAHTCTCTHTCTHSPTRHPPLCGWQLWNGKCVFRLAPFSPCLCSRVFLLSHSSSSDLVQFGMCTTGRLCSSKVQRCSLSCKHFHWISEQLGLIGRLYLWVSFHIESNALTDINLLCSKFRPFVLGIPTIYCVVQGTRVAQRLSGVQLNWNLRQDRC